MKKTKAIPRILALFLSGSLALPSPALALRPITTTQSGVEEDLASRLHSSAPPAVSPAARHQTDGGQAGAEEKISRRDAFRRIAYSMAGSVIGGAVGGAAGNVVIPEGVKRAAPVGKPHGRPAAIRPARDVSPAEAWLVYGDPAVVTPGARLLSVRRIEPEGRAEQLVLQIQPERSQNRTVARLPLRLPQPHHRIPTSREYDEISIQIETPPSVEVLFQLFSSDKADAAAWPLIHWRPELSRTTYGHLPAERDWVGWERFGQLRTVELTFQHPMNAAPFEVVLDSMEVARKFWYADRQERQRALERNGTIGGAFIGAALGGIVGYHQAKKSERSGNPPAARHQTDGGQAGLEEGIETSGRAARAVVFGDPDRSTGPQWLETRRMPQTLSRLPLQSSLRFKPPDDHDGRQVEQKAHDKNPGPERPTDKGPNDQSGENDDRRVRRQPGQVLTPFGGQPSRPVHRRPSVKTNFFSNSSVPSFPVSVKPTSYVVTEIAGPIPNMMISQNNNYISNIPTAAGLEERQALVDERARVEQASHLIERSFYDYFVAETPFAPEDLAPKLWEWLGNIWILLKDPPTSIRRVFYRVFGPWGESQDIMCSIPEHWKTLDFIWINESQRQLSRVRVLSGVARYWTVFQGKPIIQGQDLIVPIYFSPFGGPGGEVEMVSARDFKPRWYGAYKTLRLEIGNSAVLVKVVGRELEVKPASDTQVGTGQQSGFRVKQDVGVEVGWGSQHSPEFQGRQLMTIVNDKTVSRYHVVATLREQGGVPRIWIQNLSLKRPVQIKVVDDEVGITTKPVRFQAGLEEQAKAQAELRQFIAHPDIDDVIRLIFKTSPAGSINLARLFPRIAELLPLAGYERGLALLVPFRFLPEGKLDGVVRVYIDPNASGADQVRAKMEEAWEFIRLVDTAEEAHLVIGDERTKVSPRQALLQINSVTADRVSVSLLRYLGEKGLLRPGSVVSIYGLVAGELGEGLLIFA